MRAILLVVLVACAARGPDAPRFARAFAQAIDTRDPAAAAALFAPDADASLVPAPPAHGRAAIAVALQQALAHFADAHVAVGRIWIGRDASVIELAFTGRGGKVGVIAAAVIAFDDRGRARTARLYVDLTTIVGQIDPSRVPEGVRPRAPVTAPPGAAIAATTGSPVEAANDATTSRIWAGLDRHDPALVLAPSTADYIYDDFSGPAPLDLEGTRALLRNFLGLVPDFVIAAEPTRFAAGDEVITESVEHMTFRGRAVTLHGLDVKHFTHGRVDREWQYANGAELFTELLGLPPLTVP